MLKRIMHITLFFTLVLPWTLYAASFQVGPDRGYKTLQEITMLLNPGDVVEVDGDHTYPGDIIFDRPGTPAEKIHIKGIRINGHRPVISGGNNGVSFTTPWPYTGPDGGHHYIFEGFEITAAVIRGIFHQAKDLTVRDCLVRDCPAHGILGADQGSGSLHLEYTEVTGCGQGDNRHQIYMATDEVNNPGSVFRMQHCYIHDGAGGNNVKSRAERNEIYYNWIEGAFYHELELIGPDSNADGGDPFLKREDSDVVGNVFIKKTTSAGNNPDFYVIRIGGDGTGASHGRYRFLNNTIISGSGSVFRMFDELESVEIQNNVFFNPHGNVMLQRNVDAIWVSGQEMISGKNNWIKTGVQQLPVQLTQTVMGEDPGFTDLDEANFYPAENSPLVNAGTLPTASAPGFEILNPLASPLKLPPHGAIEAVDTALSRVISDTIDIGAFEEIQTLEKNDSGSLHITIQPEAVRTAGAQWRRSGSSIWQDNDAVEANIPAGTYPIEFKTIDSWSNPAQPAITVVPGLPVKFTGIYARQHGDVLYVDNNNQSTIQNGSAQYPYTSIQTAVDNSDSGDTIKTAMGTYGHVETMGKALTFLGGYPGADTAAYAAGQGGIFSQRDLNPSATVISGGSQNNGVMFTRFDDTDYHGVLDNFTISQSQKGVVADTAMSWPHPDNLTISNTIVENNGQVGETSTGAGILICGHNGRILNNIIRNNHGGRGAGLARSGKPTNLLVDGNRIENNSCYDDHAGGVYLDGTITLTNNLITGNRVEMSYGWGGGVLILGTAQMSFNIISNNYAPNYGGGVFIDDGATAYMQNDLVHHNHTSYSGGAGIAVDGLDGFPASTLHLTNCTIAWNTSEGNLGGNGIFLDRDSSVSVVNSIFWGNTDDFYIRDNSGNLTMTWSLSNEVFEGTGNLAADPLFADPSNGDFHLKSITGRYNPSTGNWMNDSLHSPAIDAGHPDSPFGCEPQPNGARINLGAFGNTAQASRTKTAAPAERCIITGLEVTGTPSTTTPVTYTVNALSDSSSINYRYSIRTGYGTSAYDNTPWQSMTATEYQTNSSCDYSFGSSGKSIVVVWATSSDISNVNPDGVPIIGWSVDTSDTGCNTHFTGVSITGDQKVNENITFTVNAHNSCSQTQYYRFSMHPDYGTAGYDGTRWQSMTGSEWITDNFTDYVFTQAGKYIIVVWVADDPYNYNQNSIPIIGWSVDIE